MTRSAELARVLDDDAAIARLDSEDVLSAVERFADQCIKGWETGLAAAGLPDALGVDSVVLFGMGGSGVSGDIVRAVIEPRFPFPFQTIKGYGPVPAWVGRNTMVFAVSYSGDTEETLAATDEALQRGARIITVSSGGRLAGIAAEHGLAHVGVPSGLQPRAALGYMTMPVLGVLARTELIPDMQDDIDEAVEVVAAIADRSHRKHPVADNPAKELASQLLGKLPVVYGGRGIGSVAAYRFKCDLNEYAKTPSIYNEIPELDHNEIVGWNNLSKLTSQNFAGVFLRDTHEDERIALRFGITRRLIEPRLATITEVTSEGESDLARLLSLVLKTQLTAIYLGLAYGVDPGPVEVIAKLKAELTRAASQ